MKRIIGAKTPLERHVQRWINKKAEDYPDTGIKGVLKDLAYGGCNSGMVGHLIYYHDTVQFALKYLEDILNLCIEEAESMGNKNLWEFLAQGNPNYAEAEDADQALNYLAWVGFEETARALAYKNGIEY